VKNSQTRLLARLFLIAVIPAAAGCQIIGENVGQGTGAIVGGGIGLLRGDPSEGVASGAAAGRAVGGYAGQELNEIISNPLVYAAGGYTTMVNYSPASLQLAIIEQEQFLRRMDEAQRRYAIMDFEQEFPAYDPVAEDRFQASSDSYEYWR